MGEEPKCSKCKHWGRGETDGNFSLEESEVLNTKRCGKAVQLWDASEWNADLDRVALPQYADQLMFVKDGSDYRADLYTKADFFCAHFEP